MRSPLFINLFIDVIAWLANEINTDQEEVGKC